MDDFDLAIKSEGEITTRYDLRAEFYRRNRFREYFWDGTSKLSASRPLAFIRNETEVGMWIRVQYGRYYVIIDKGGKLLSGPHVGKLYFMHKSEPEGIWLGTKQFDGPFFDDKGLKRQLREAIKQREYWMSLTSEDEELILEEPKEIIDIKEEPVVPHPLSHGTKHVRYYYISPKRAGRIPRCPKCQCIKSKWRNICAHYQKKHGKQLVVFQPKPLDKCPPL